MTEQTPLTDAELRVLECLSDHYNADANCFPFKPLSEQCELTIDVVADAVRSLTRRGYAQFVRGLWDDEGKPAGSGYCCTRAGRDFFRTLDAHGELTQESKP